MKINIKEILINPKNIKYKKKIFLIYGNEETLIKKIENTLVRVLKKLNFNEKIYLKNKDILDNFEEEIPTSLFSTSRILICNNPKEVSISALEKLNFENIAVIIVHTSLKASSTLKINFDTHKHFLSIGCYKINRELKKDIVDSFLTSNKIHLEIDASCYLLDNSSDIFGLLENDLKKISNYNKDQISLKEVRSLLSFYENKDGIEDLFLSNLSSKNIIDKSHKLINSSADFYILIQRIKFYLYIFFKSENSSDLERNIPGYLFAKKKNLVALYEKINKQKYLVILKLLKKTEFLLRKNEKMYLLLSQRFLLNLKKTIK